jgi:hypothetical protein
LNNFTKKYRGIDLSNMVEMEQDHQIYRTQQENFKTKVVQVWKITNFDRQAEHFSMVLLWGQLHRDFLRFAN